MWCLSSLTFALTNAAFFVLNWTYASVKQRVETFPSCQCVILLCDFSLSTDVPKHFLGSFSLFWYWKKFTPKVDIVLFSVSVVPRLHCLLLVVSALQWKHLICCFQCSSHFHFTPQIGGFLCLVTAVCLHAAYNETEQDSLISNELTLCNWYKQTQTTQLSYWKRKTANGSAVRLNCACKCV